MKMLPVLCLLVSAATSAHAAEPRYDNGFVLESGDGEPVYRLRLNGRLQTRLTLKSFDDASDKDAQVAMARVRALAAPIIDNGVDKGRQAASDAAPDGFKLPIGSTASVPK